MTSRKLVYTALFAALTAAGAFLRIPLGVSSITLQFLFTAMAGVLLGAGCGALSQSVYVALGLIGLPIFTTGGGFAYVLQPTFGFLLGLIPTAAVIGALTRRNASPVRVALACVAGLAVLYAVGVPYMALILNGYMGKGMASVGGHAAVPARRRHQNRRDGAAVSPAAQAHSRSGVSGAYLQRRRGML